LNFLQKRDKIYLNSFKIKNNLKGEILNDCIIKKRLFLTAPKRTRKHKISYGNLEEI